MSINISVVFTKAVEQKISGLYDEAIYSFKTVIEAAPSHAGAHHELGLIYSFQVMIDESICELETATKLDPDNVTYLLSLAKTLTMFGEFERAKQVFIDILVIDPFNDDADKNLDYLKSV